MAQVNLLGLTLYPYGAAVAMAAALALALTCLLAKREGIRPGAISWLAVLGVPLGVLGARLGYCLSAIDWVAQEGVGFFFRFTQGGYLLYGAALGCTLAILAASRITGERFLRLADVCAAPAALLIALSRLAEGLVSEGYGWGVSDWFMEDMGMSVFTLEDPSFFCRFPFAVMDMYESWNWAVFVLEGLLAIAMLAILLRQTKRAAGGRVTLLALMYAASQVLCESLRQDAVLRFGFVRVNQILGAVLIVFLLVVCILRSGERSPRSIMVSAVGVVIGVLLVVAMEFALEGKISAIEWMPMDVCYLIMTLACALIMASVLRLWKRAYPLQAS